MKQLFVNARNVLWFCWAISGHAAEVPQGTRAFIESHCMDCHDANTARAGFRIDLLTADFTAGNTAGQWKEVMDKVKAGEMPPKKKPRPDAREVSAVVSWVAQKLDQTTKAAQAAGGCVPMRRMNRAEYANSVRDLFSLDENFARRVEKELPADGKVGGFDRGAASLFMDDGQLDQYMAVADLVLDEAVFNERPKTQHLTWDGRKEKYVHGIGVCYKDAAGKIMEDNPTPEFVSQLKEPLTMIPIAGFQQWDSKERRYVTHGPFDWTIKGDGIEYLADCRFFGWDWGNKGVTRDGWYKIRIKAGAFKGEGAEAQKDVRLTVKYGEGSPVEVFKTTVIDAPLDAPKEYEFRMYLQIGPPGMRRSWRISWDFGERKEAVMANPAYWDVQWKQVLIAGQIERALREHKPAEDIASLRNQSVDQRETALNQRKTFEGPYWIYNPKLDIAKRPRIWLGKMEWEGPLVDWPPPGRKALFFAGEEREDDAYLHEIFARFLPRAFRRPVTSEELDRVVQWTLATKSEHGLSFTSAVREGVKNVLCSPAFLYLGSEGMPSPAPAVPQPLDGWQLASRLSYFLWSSAPDDELCRLASEDKLRKPEVLRQQVKRMIADPKAWEFVRNFAGQWLGVRNFANGNPPNRDFYKFYDDALRDSSKREPLEFFNVVLKQDLPLTSFIDSDFLVVNERLAKHYDIDGVDGDTFRRVAAPADHRRGGVLGMAGILTYLADGTRTLPVRRAAWVLDTLWNRPVPNPPPNVGDLPIIKEKEKKLSVRARLEQHRLTESCASCHGRVDSFGLALENYDATGMWRDRQNGEGMRGQKNDPELDASGQLPDGAAFKSVQEFKDALLARKDALIQGFTEKLLCYAIGRQVGYADHLTVDRIAAGSAASHYSLQELIQQTVASQYFLTQ